jgi:flavin-dependent dehydrogenase
MTLYDTAIIGGGPAGCSAAITLAQRGMRVVLFEAKSYPHHKVCGEFLSPECLYFLDELGAKEAVRHLGPIPIDTARFTEPSGVTWETALPGTAWSISRAALDATLADCARSLGVEVREKTTVADITGCLGSVFELDIRTGSPIQAKTVIGAHGKRGALDRALDRQFLDHYQPFVGLKAHFRGPAIPNRLDMHTFPGGYCGISEIENGEMNVCLLARQESFQSARDYSIVQPDSFIRWMKQQNTPLRLWLDQAEQITERWLSIGQVPFIRKRAVVNDVLMAGDAAGLIAPVAGDGIAMALHGGRMAATYAADYLENRISADELRDKYNHDWHRIFNTRLRLGRVLQAIMFRPRLLAPTLKILNAVPPVGSFLVNHTRDTRFIGNV